MENVRYFILLHNDALANRRFTSGSIGFARDCVRYEAFGGYVALLNEVGDATSQLKTLDLITLRLPQSYACASHGSEI